jgi:hypothetical protein
MQRITTLAVAATLVFAACADSGPVDPRLSADDAVLASLTAPGQQRLAGVDAEFARMARDIPGFGGMFYDDDGNLVVYMAGSELQRADERAAHRRDVRSQVGRSLQAHGRDVPAPERILLREGAYDFLELAAQNQRMLPILGVPGVVFTDIDESQNRLKVGIEEGASEERIQDALRMLDIPLELVTLEVTEAIVPLSGGDSGSPVFAQHGDTKDVTLHGILWGGGGGAYVFSALANIRMDFGDFRTH